MNPVISKLKALFTAMLLAGIASFSARADYQSTVLSQNPVAYWRLNETGPVPPPGPATNSGTLGATDNGTFTDFPSKGVPGAIGGSDKGVAFNGISQWILAPYDANINTPAFTIEAWLRPDVVAVPGGLTCALSSVHAGSPRSGWLIYQNFNGGAAGSGWTFRTYNQNAANTAINVTASNAVVAGTWYHVVATYDGTTARVYVNGVQKASQVNSSFVPNVDSPFSIGARSDTGFPWTGAADEVAYYNTALSAAQVLANYNAGIAANPSAYATQVLGLNPLGYWRLDEPAEPPATNLGSLGSAANGRYFFNAAPGQNGPQPPTYAGLEAGNKGCSFDGVSGSVRVPALNLNTNTVTLTAWVKPNGAQAPQAGIFFNQGSVTSAKFALQFGSSAFGLGLAYNWNNIASGINWASGVNLVDGDWNFAALIIRPDQAILFVPGQTPATNFAAHPVLAMNGQSFIGATFTNINGTIDEVSLFNRSLSLGEVFSQYAAAVGNFAPQVFGDPSSPPVFAGDTLNLTVDAGGTPNLSYQWRKNTAPISGATSSSYSKAGVTAADNGSYDCVITNDFGTATSAGVAIIVNALTPPAVSQGPASRTLYTGATLNLNVVASGGHLAYQWSKNSSPIANATNSAYIVSSVTTADAGSYTVSVTNSLGTASGGPAVITIPTLASGTFAAVVAADAPEAWWRLDEASGATVMADVMGRHDGFYSNATGGLTLGSPGAVSNGVFGTSASFNGSGFGWVPYSPALNGGQFSVECWVYLTNVVNGISPVSSHDSPAAGYFIGTQSGEWHGFIGSAGTDFYFGQPVGQAPPYNPAITPGQWTHVVITCDPSGAFPLRFYFNGTTDGFIWGDFTRNTAAALVIGACGQGINSPNRNVVGRVDEVAVYTRPLTAAQVTAHYNAGIFVPNTPPSFITQPLSQSIVAGSNVTFSASAGGTTPLSYQWLKNGAPIANSTNTSLSLSNVSFGSSGNYALRATNVAGSATSTVAVLTVIPYPSFVNATNGLVVHYKFENNYQDSSGRGNNGTPGGNGSLPSFVPGIIGANALHYFTHNDNAGPNTNGTAIATNTAFVTIGTPSVPVADMQFGASQDFSVSYWVRLPPNYSFGDLPFLCSAPNSYGNFGVTFAPSYQRGGWSWFLGNNSTGIGLYGPDNSINNGSWHNLVHTFARSGNGITYLDGVMVNITSIVGAGDIDTGLDFNIGQDGSGLYPEEGAADIDDLGVWRRVLTQAEAQGIYLVGKGFGRSFDTYGPVSVSINKAGTDFEVIWQAGTLLQADSVTGPWTPVAGATAPYYKFTPTGGNKFFRIQL